MGRRKKSSTTEKVPGQRYINLFTWDKDYVFYDRLDQPARQGQEVPSWWRTIKQSALAEFSNNVEFFNTVTYSEIADALINQGYIEQQKEMTFLNQAFGIPMNPIPLREYSSYITIINSVLDLQKDWKDLVELLQRGKRGETKGDERKAYNIIASFPERIISNFRKLLDSFFKQKNVIAALQAGDQETITLNIQKLFNQAITNVISQVNQSSMNIDNSQLKTWDKALQIISSTEGLLNQLQSDLFERFNLTTVTNDLINWESNNVSNNNSQRGLSSVLRSSVSVTPETFQDIDSIIMNYVETLTNGTYSIGSNNTTHASTFLTNSESNISEITLFSYAARANLQEFSDVLNINLMNSSPYYTSEEIINDFTQYLTSFKDIFVIYKSTSLFNSNFTESASGPLQQLPSFLDEMGVNMNGNQLVQVLYNTIPGAIGEAYSQEINYNISRLLSEAIAQFLYKDWSAMANDFSTNNAIYVFDIAGILTPLSYLLIAIGSAIQNTLMGSGATSYDVDITVPNSILYSEPIRPFDKEVRMEGYWDRQKEAAINQSSFSIVLQRDLESLIVSTLNSL